MPSSLQQRNQALFRRTVALTETAIAKLQTEHEPVTLANVAAATRLIDGQGRGISSTTIVRNPQALAIFRRHSPAYQKKLAYQAAKAPTKLSPPGPDPYQTLGRLDLIQVIETLQAENDWLKARLSTLQVERDMAYRLRDEALDQNSRQLAALARLMDRPKPNDEANEPQR